MKPKNTAAKVVAQIIKKTAIVACQNYSLLGFHQPKVPKKLQK